MHNLLSQTNAPSAEVLELVLERNGFGDGHTILGDFGTSESLLNDDVPPLRSESDRHSLGKDVDASKHGRPTIVGELQMHERQSQRYFFDP